MRGLRVQDRCAVTPDADTVELEAEIDRLVYALYGLTAEEVAGVEGRV